MTGAKRTSLVAVVDDDDLLRDALRRLLKASGLGAVSFESAEALLNSGRLPEIACLIADVRMPDISGLELQARLKAERCPVPIIFITARRDQTVRTDMLERGAIDCLFKPFSATALLEALKIAFRVIAEDHP